MSQYPIIKAIHDKDVYSTQNKQCTVFSNAGPFWWNCIFSLSLSYCLMRKEIYIILAFWQLAFRLHLYSIFLPPSVLKNLLNVYVQCDHTSWLHRKTEYWEIFHAILFPRLIWYFSLPFPFWLVGTTSSNGPSVNMP